MGFNPWLLKFLLSLYTGPRFISVQGLCGDIVKATAEEFGIPYYEYPTIPKAVASHLRVLRALGRPAAA